MNVTSEGNINFNKHNNNWETIRVICTPIKSNVLQPQKFLWGGGGGMQIWEKQLKTCELKVWKWSQLLITAKEIIPNILAHTQQLETWTVLPATAISVPVGTRHAHRISSNNGQLHGVVSKLLTLTSTPVQTEKVTRTTTILMTK